jgi:hypothetical protein
MSPSREGEGASKSSRQTSNNCDKRLCAAASVNSLSIFFRLALGDMASASKYSGPCAADASSRAAYTFFADHLRGHLAAADFSSRALFEAAGFRSESVCSSANAPEIKQKLRGYETNASTLPNSLMQL